MSLRSPTTQGWRLVAFTLCAATAFLWVSSQLLAVQSCQSERERAARAEELIAKDQASRERERALESRVADLESRLSQAQEKARPAIPCDCSAEKAEAEQLRTQVALLQRQIKEQEGRAGAVTQQAASPVQAAPDQRVVPVQTGFLARSGRITEQNLKQAAQGGAIGVVVISCKRPKYLKKSMDSILKPSPDPTRFPLVISQDDFDTAMTDMIRSTYVEPGIAFHMQHPHQSDAIQIANRFGGSSSALGYVRIAQHFGFAMRRMFDDFGFQQVIFLEEDIQIAPDFFSYFGAMLPLLQNDKDLFCVSAWNDNGLAPLVHDPRAAFRTDFFPGLGWMMLKTLWDELRDRWAVAYWDDFVRRPDVRKGRQCLRPEVSRTYTFGEEGVSAGQFFGTHLQHIRLNSESIDWSKEDLSRLASAQAFDAYLTRQLQAARQVSLSELLDGNNHFEAGRELRVEYDDQRDYAQVSRRLGLMPDEKEGIRRMSYRGVIPFSWLGHRVYLYTRQWPSSLPSGIS